MFGWYCNWGYLLCLIPIVGIVGGRWRPYLQVFFVTAIPIARKTVRNLIYEQDVILFDWNGFPQRRLALDIYLVCRALAAHGVPLRVLLVGTSALILANGLLFCTWLYFALNFAFFRFPGLVAGNGPAGLRICAAFSVPRRRPDRGLRRRATAVASGQ